MNENYEDIEKDNLADNLITSDNIKPAQSMAKLFNPV